MCDSSAGIIRIRFAGRGLADLLSARDHQAPRALFYCHKKYMLLFKNVKFPNRVPIRFDAS